MTVQCSNKKIIIITNILICDLVIIKISSPNNYSKCGEGMLRGLKGS